MDDEKICWMYYCRNLNGSNGYCCETPFWDNFRISHWASAVWELLWACLLTLLDVMVLGIVVFIVIGLIWAFVVAKGRQVTRYGPLIVKRLPNGKRELLQDFKVRIEDAEPIIVEKEFKTDFSSIPTPLQWTMHWSKVDIAGVVHDWLYANAKTIKATRRETDKIWRDIALNGEHHARRLQAAAGWLALRWFGGGIWRGYERNPPAHLLPKGEIQPPDEGNGGAPEGGKAPEGGGVPEGGKASEGGKAPEGGNN